MPRERVAASQADAIAFETPPFSVIAAGGATYPRDKVDQVVRAFEAVFGIHRLQTIASVQDLVFDSTRRP